MGTLISGPRYDRLATTSERRAILEVIGVPSPRASCIRFGARVSKIDSRFASIEFRFVPPYTQRCSPSNPGDTLMVKAASGLWHLKDERSDAFECRRAPPGVIRSLFKGCMVGQIWRKPR